MYFSQPGKKLLALSRLKGIGEKTLSSLRRESKVMEMDLKEILYKSFDKKDLYSNKDLSEAEYFSEKQEELCKLNNISFHSLFDENYPASLLTLQSPPPFLFCKGAFSCLSEKSVAVIGTREPTSHGIEITKRITRWLLQEQFNIVSGLAHGIDSITHKQTILSGGKAVAVLAHGLDIIYPKVNEELAEKIIKSGGTLISEYPVGMKLNPTTLVKRDAIQAALSSAVFLMQTGIKGGSLHASRATLQFGRPLVVVGQSATDIYNNESKIQGNLTLLRGSQVEINELLKSKTIDENLLLKLNSKSDYKSVLTRLEPYLFTEKKHNSKNNGFDF